MSTAERLQTARTLTGMQDAKAAAVLSAAGVLLTAGGLVTALGHPGTVTLWLARAAGIAALYGVLALLHALYPRGGSPRSWLLAGQKPEHELQRVAWLAGRKHLALQQAIWALELAVVLGGLAVINT